MALVAETAVKTVSPILPRARKKFCFTSIPRETKKTKNFTNIPRKKINSFTNINISPQQKRFQKYLPNKYINKNCFTNIPRKQKKRFTNNLRKKKKKTFHNYFTKTKKKRSTNTMNNSSRPSVP